MEEIENKWISYINGYIDALNDISGEQREFVANVFMTESNENNVLLALKNHFNDMNDFKIINKKIYDNCYSEGVILEKMLLTKPFSGFYPLEHTHVIPEDIIKPYKSYSLSHLSDYIDFVFSLDDEDDYSFQIQMFLIKNNETSFIVLQLRKYNMQLHFCFFREGYDEKTFSKWFDEVHEYMDLNQLQKRERKNENYSSHSTELDGFTEEEKKEIETLATKAISQGEYTQGIVDKLRKYYSQEKIEEFKAKLNSP